MKLKQLITFKLFGEFMKNLIILMALLSTFTVSARSIHPLTYVLTAELTEAMNIDDNSYLKNMRIHGGSVQVKQLRREIVLTLNVAPDCQAGMVCPAVLTDHVITLPLVSQKYDECGNTTYIAKKDLRPVDGAMELLSVTDHTDNKCPTFVALPETGVTFQTSFYDRINGGEVSTYSSFEAGKLKGRVFATSRLKEVLPALK
ncbi:MAG: hypothetical protein ACJAT2_001330 [Bacteriovoracaceae bacterium]